MGKNVSRVTYLYSKNELSMLNALIVILRVYNGSEYDIGIFVKLHGFARWPI